MPSLNKNIFRAYDIRGIVGVDVTNEMSYKIGRAFGTYVINNKKKVVGISGDVRPSTDSLLENLQKGLYDSGIDVINLGKLPTPLNYFSSYSENIKIDGSIQITGSHNPSEYNGFKLTFNKKPFHGIDIINLYEIIKNEKFINNSGKISSHNIINEYLTMIHGKINITNKIRVAIDCGNAAGCIIAPNLYKNFNIDLYEIYCNIDGTFPNHHPDPTVDKNLLDIQNFVLENKCDLGLAFDGDADRIIAIDEKGNIIRSDILMTVFLPYLIKNNDPIVFDVKCSKSLEDMILRYNGKPIMWKTGHSLIKNKMKEVGAKFGGEMSGHIFFADDYYGYDDAIYVGLRLIEILSNSKLSLSQIISDVPKYCSTPEIRFNCADDDEKVIIMKRAFSYFSTKFDYSSVDGIRINLELGWALIRCSNTQPVIVCRIEATNNSTLEEYKELVINKLISFGIKQDDII